MKATVVIPLHNRKDLICYTLDSLKPDLHQGVELEVIVVDDDSQDGAYELVAQQYPWVQLYKSPGRGAPAARNFGWGKANSEIIHFLDSDDLVDAGFYTERIKALEQDTTLGAVYGPWLTFKGLAYFTKENLLPAHTAYPLRAKEQGTEHMTALLKGWYLHPSTLVFRKRALQAISGFEESLIVNQDVDLLFKFLIHGHTLLGIDAAPSLVRAHALNRVGVVSGDLHKMQTMLALRKKFIKQLEDKGLVSDSFRKALGEFCMYRFAEYYKINKDIALQFYELGHELYPDYQLKGGVWIRLLAKLLGNKNAVVFKKIIS